MAISKYDRDLTEFLLTKKAEIFLLGNHKDKSPFFQAINSQSIWAIELLCDHGANVMNTSISGMNPLIYAASRGFDEICMYLSLRTKDVDVEDTFTGKTTFFIYMQKKDLLRMKQLLMRGSDINYMSSKRGQTALHYAVQKKYPVKIIKFLINSGANPHIEDKHGKDCC